jgi:hypothetical protein
LLFTLNQGVDHFYDARHPYKPVVVNTAAQSIDTDYNVVQTERWLKAIEFDVAMPGFAQAMDGMPTSSWKDW